MSICKGKKLMVFLKEGNGTYKSIAFATNHTLSTSASTLSVSHKDLADTASGSGKWASQDIDELSWTITSENLYANTGEGYTFADLFNFYAAGTELDLKFAVADNSTSGVPQGGWVPPASGTVLQGKAVISSLDVNAPVDENASFSCTLTGKGPLSVAS